MDASVPAVGGLALRHWRLGAAIVFPIYVFTTWKLGGLRVEHVVIAGLFLGLFLASPRTARFAVLALPFLLVGILYDNIKYALPIRGAIHVGDLYAAEKALFSIDGQTINEYFKANPIVFFDLVCGFAYLAYLAESFGFGVYLYFRDRQLLQKFAWAFLLVNILGMITYLVYPAAPPWYVEQYGVGEAVLTAAPSAAGAARFDQLLGVTYFQTFYSRNANVFGAMPSLHCAYPTLVILASVKLGKRWIIPSVAFALLVAFSAVYLRHHYVLDVIAGVVFATLAWGVVLMFERIVWRRHA